MDEIKCWYIRVTGMVQGLGFRPFIYRLAHDWGLTGWVLNSGQGVIIEIQGRESSLRGFYKDLPQKKPSLAKIVQLNYQAVPIKDYYDFRILESQVSKKTEVHVPPDLAICPECRKEILAEGERYHHYPFTNCTYCGPRFTVIKDLPYDRASTSMAEFKMCQECDSDYHNPLHRRFHAQPTACHQCGPQVSLVDKSGLPINGDWVSNFHDLIKKGMIFAVKGIGGYHLVCSATNSEPIKKLRDAKKRPFRPFAVMARDLETVQRYCHVSLHERSELTSPAAPIVILDTLEGKVSEVLAPNNPTLGVMLPYSPLHILLFSDDIDLLVMTSGNSKGLPIVKDNSEALRELAPYIDYFLTHNREIVSRCDDSVIRIAQQRILFYRRSRGYVPSPIQVRMNVEAPVLGLGSEMKNTFCLLKDNNAYLSQHIGEMNSLQSIENYRQSLNHLENLLEIKPLIIGYDPHPGSNLNIILNELSQETGGNKILPVTYPVQHHHAHMTAVMAENGLNENVIGAILDGTGYGLDNTLWGFEILVGNYSKFTRPIHLANVPLPGGERAIRNPWLVASAYLLTYLGEEGKELITKLFPDHMEEIPLLERMIDSQINAPLASSAGRLFDAVAAILGICLYNTFDGQAAIEIGELAYTLHRKQGIQKQRWGTTPYSFSITINGIIEVKNLLQQIIRDFSLKYSKESIALKFHYTIAEMVVEGIKNVHLHTGLKKVVLSGGVWQNPLLLELVVEALNQSGYSVYTHQNIPANDGGLALGQAASAYHMWLEEK